MVVIDAEKHHLNYKQSYIDNGIASLKEKYQGRGATGRLAGASTLISKSGTNSKVRVPERKLRSAAKGGPIDPVTGEHVYENTDASYVDPKTGKTIVKTSEVPRLGNVSDAHELSSGMPIENIYADYSNSLKALSNDARKASLTTGKLVYSPTAAKTYASQVARLNGALNTALKNKPKERQAQLVANAIVAAKIADNPSIENADLKKIKGQALMTARERVGASKEQIEISPDEWEAIQAGAISDNKLSDILDNADIDKVKELATPRAAHEMTPSKIALAKARLASGYTQAEVAESLGVPVSTLNSAIKREGG
jgi:DNA-binding transcriptional regulator YiaG